MFRLTILAAFAAALPLRAGEFKAAGPEHDREAVTCHLPEREHLRNAAGNDGLGLCVFTSIDLAARWANEQALIGFRDFMIRHAGGGYPEKVDQYVPKMAATKGLPVPGYVQHTGGDPEFLRAALKTGRYVCVTYDGRDGVFYRGRVAHMVNLVHLSDRLAAIQDNNYPGEWLWMSPADFLERWKGTGGGWAVVLLRPGPPPIPVNKQFHVSSSKIQVETTDLRRGIWNLQLATARPRAGIAEDDDPNFGIDRERISTARHYRLNGRDVSRDEALRVLGAIPDDTDRLRLTVVGDSELRRRVRADLDSHPALAPVRSRVSVQDYAPDHWAVADVGFAPGVTLQLPPGPDGKAPVLWRMSSYSGPDLVAGAIRKADPLYKPDRDPDPSKPDPTKPDPAKPEPAKPEPAKPAAIPFDFSDLSPATWAVVGLILGLLLKRRDEK
ncbi:MAG TPA: hypothetical protein VKE40_19730 [Gemmataceae bacterium]|nr:hypothetical protein [Gemmataceae bacterium]